MRARIVIIEDNPTSRDFMLRLLDGADYDIAAAADGEAGLALARSTAPHLIICDIGLPGMSGYELVRRLKADSATRKIPVIAVTAFAMRDTEQRALAAGFDAFLPKPVAAEALLARARAAIQSQKGRHV